MEISVDSGKMSLIKSLPRRFMNKMVDFALAVKNLGQEDPRRIVHAFKVGLAITIVSLFYYYQPLYNGFGVSAMWAVLTVVVVFEFSVGKLLDLHICVTSKRMCELKYYIYYDQIN